jgi:hypothetical protein
MEEYKGINLQIYGGPHCKACEKHFKRKSIPSKEFLQFIKDLKKGKIPRKLSSISAKYKHMWE